MNLAIDMPSMLEFLQGLLRTPSPSGYHTEAIEYVREAFQRLNLPELELRQNHKGALIATLVGRAQDAPRALSAHVDTLGAMVRQVKGNGRLLLTQIGGYAWNAVEGEGVTIHCSKDGRRWRGTIQTISPSVHTSPDARDGKRDDERMEVRIDARTTSREETLALGIEVGDFVFLDPRVELTDTGFLKSRHLDDKAGVAILYGLLLALNQHNLQASQRTTFLVSNFEELGHGAATGIPRDVVELLVIDMAAGTTGEHQNSDEFSVGICAKDTSGPYDLDMRRRLTRLAEAQGIPYRIDTYPHYGSDALAALRAGADLRAALIGPGVDASHAYERTHVDSLEATARLALAYVLENN